MQPGGIYKKMGQLDHEEETEPCSTNWKGRTVPCLLYTLADLLVPLSLIISPFFYNTTISQP
jgi:hypothetical protein